MPFVTDSDVKVLHDRLATEWTTIAAAASNASSQLSKDQMATMGTLASRVSSYLGDGPSLFRAGSQMDTGQALEKDVFEFADSLRSSGVPGLPASPAAAPKSTLDRIVELAPILLVAAVVFSLTRHR